MSCASSGLYASARPTHPRAGTVCRVDNLLAGFFEEIKALA